MFLNVIHYFLSSTFVQMLGKKKKKKTPLFDHNFGFKEMQFYLDKHSTLLYLP